MRNVEIFGIDIVTILGVIFVSVLLGIIAYYLFMWLLKLWNEA